MGTKLRDWLMYATMRCVLALLQSLPWSAGRALARLMGDVAYMLDRPERKAGALSNLRKAFPALDRKEALRILRGVYEHLLESLLDAFNFAHVARRRSSANLFEAVGWDTLRDISPETGAILVTGHFGHWEVLGAALPLLGFPAWALARFRRNPFFDRYVRRVRTATGMRILPRHGAMRRALHLLKRGEIVAFLMDQDARHRGIFVEFFGRPASTTTTVARLAIRTGCPVAFAYGRRIPGQNRFRLVLKDVFTPVPGADTKSEVFRITQRLTSDLEEAIREAPQEWLWLHRRWKTYPGKYGSKRPGGG